MAAWSRAVTSTEQSAGMSDGGATTAAPAAAGLSPTTAVTATATSAGRNRREKGTDALSTNGAVALKSRAPVRDRIRSDGRDDPGSAGRVRRAAPAGQLVRRRRER